MAFNSKALITIQVGHYSNFVGSHFWNSQDLSFSVNKDKNDIDHDVLFREGVTLSGKDVTYTPRLVTVDLKGALGSLPEFGDLYHQVGLSVPKTDLSAQSGQHWQHKVDIRRDETHRKTQYLKDLETADHKHDEGKDVCSSGDQPSVKDDSTIVNELEDEVKLWSDFLRSRYHPKTNVIVQDYHHANPAEPFDVFGLGSSAWTDGSYGLGDEIENRLRFFAEEADHLTGFQLIADCSDAFGGLSSALTDYIKDDYHAQVLLSFPMLPAHYDGTLNAISCTNKVLNTALTLRAHAENCNLVTPLSLSGETFPLKGMQLRQFKGLNFKPELNYHTSGILASALDTITLPWRLLKGPYASPFDVASGLSGHGKKVANVEFMVPFPKPLQDKLSPFLSTYDVADLTSITPHCNRTSFDDTVWCQSASVRGILGSNNPHLDFLGYFDRVMPKTATAVTQSRNPFQAGKPFPFNMVQSPCWDAKDKTLPTMSLWQSSRNSGVFAKMLAERSGKVKLNKLHRFHESGLEQDVLEAAIEELCTLSECYDTPSDAM